MIEQFPRAASASRPAGIFTLRKHILEGNLFQCLLYRRSFDMLYAAGWLESRFTRFGRELIYVLEKPSLSGVSLFFAKKLFLF